MRAFLAFVAIMLTLGYFSGTSNQPDHSIGAVIEDGRERTGR